MILPRDLRQIQMIPRIWNKLKRSSFDIWNELKWSSLGIWNKLHCMTQMLNANYPWVAKNQNRIQTDLSLICTSCKTRATRLNGCQTRSWTCTETKWIVKDELLNCQNSNRTNHKLSKLNSETEANLNWTKVSEPKRGIKPNLPSEFTNGSYSSVGWRWCREISKRRSQNQSSEQKFILKVLKSGLKPSILAPISTNPTPNNRIYKIHFHHCV